MQSNRKYCLICKKCLNIKNFKTVQEKIDILNDRLERECYGSGERSLPPGDIPDYPDTKTLSKQKCKKFIYHTYPYRTKVI